MSTIYGSLQESKWRAYMTFSLTEDATAVTVTASGGVYAESALKKVHEWNCTLAGTGHTDSEGRTSEILLKAGVQKKIVSKTFTWNKEPSAATKKITVTAYRGDGEVESVKTISIAVPALESFDVTYEADGGEGAPASQLKYYGRALTLSTIKPTRTGYTFTGWKEGMTGTAYAPGGTYSENASAALLAQWEANIYTITLDANGGEGGGKLSKTFGESVTLPEDVPVRAHYEFKGWSVFANATSATWNAGDTFSEQITANTTLYAVWEHSYTQPQITNLIAYRTDSEGNFDDTGAYAKVRFDWQSGTYGGDAVTSDSIIIKMRETGTSQYAELQTITPDVSQGSVTSGLIEGVDTSIQYDVLVVITDSLGSCQRSTYISRARFLIDINSDGSGLAFGEVAEDGVEKFVVNLDTVFKKSVNIEGADDKHYTHNQTEVSAEWEVTHNLGKNPAVTVVDSAGTEVIGEVDYISSNTCVLRFKAPFKGKAFFN